MLGCFIIIKPEKRW